MEKIIKNRKTMILLAIVLVMIVAFVIVRRSKKKKEKGNDSAASQLPMAKFPLQPYSVAGEYSAAAGSYGRQIANLQKICISKGAKLTADGMYGPKTDAVLKQFFGDTGELWYTEEGYNAIIDKYGKVL